MLSILIKLKNSKFRNFFYFKQQEFDYISEKRIEKIKSHAYDIINKHLKDISTFKDGKTDTR